MLYYDMILRFDFESIVKLIIKQVENNFFDLLDEEKIIIREAVEVALQRCSVCFKECNIKRYTKDGYACFDPIHSAQNTVFLYYLANTLFKQFNNSTLADYVYYLNKIMNGIDIFYAVELPNIMFFEHPVGTVLGRASYKDKLVVYQNCTVGGNNNKYPTVGENVSLLSYSCVLGDSKIGDNCIIASHTYIKDQDIPSNSMVFGSSPNLIIKQIKDKDLNIFK